MAVNLIITYVGENAVSGQDPVNAPGPGPWTVRGNVGTTVSGAQIVSLTWNFDLMGSDRDITIPTTNGGEFTFSISTSDAVSPVDDITQSFWVNAHDDADPVGSAGPLFTFVTKRAAHIVPDL